MQVSGLDFAAKFDTENAIIYFQAPQNEAPINFDWIALRRRRRFRIVSNYLERLNLDNLPMPSTFSVFRMPLCDLISWHGNEPRRHQV